jgi:Fe-S-cluster containining protein
LKKSENKKSGGPVDKTAAIVNSIARIYSWLDSEIGADQTCAACGKCCDFESFGHKLFVTTPEMIYFTSKIAPEDPKPMTAGACPYNTDGKCTVYEDRFAACRIFSCKTDTEAQNDLTENTLKELKGLCDTFDIPYRYVDLKTALNNPLKP